MGSGGIAQCTYNDKYIRSVSFTTRPLYSPDRDTAGGGEGATAILDAMEKRKISPLPIFFGSPTCRLITI
jgi:hypothetical protein